jgi:pimeloyl-ACP methyl ester carboxylesterase
MKNMMEPLFTHRAGWKRIYVDLPGMGQSKAEDWMKSSDDILSVILEFIDTVIPGERFVLGGMSYGGYIARGVAFRKSDHVDGMMLISPMIKPSSTERQLPPRVILEKDDALLARIQQEEPTGFETFAVVQTEKVWEKYKKDIIPGAQKADRVFLSSEFRTKGYSFSFDSELVGNIFAKPALIILGRQDAVSGFQDALSLIESYPRATYAVLDRAGHFPQLEQEEVIHCLANEWLHRLDSRTVGLYDESYDRSLP